MKTHLTEYEKKSVYYFVTSYPKLLQISYAILIEWARSGRITFNWLRLIKEFRDATTIYHRSVFTWFEGSATTVGLELTEFKKRRTGLPANLVIRCQSCDKWPSFCTFFFPYFQSLVLKQGKYIWMILTTVFLRLLFFRHRYDFSITQILLIPTFTKVAAFKME